MQQGINLGKEIPKNTAYLIETLKKDISHREKIAQLLKHAEVNKGKVKDLSKRNQKKLLSRFGWHWNPATGKLVDALKYRRTGRSSGPYSYIPVTHTTTEKISRPMANMLEAWVDGLMRA